MCSATALAVAATADICGPTLAVPVHPGCDGKYLFANDTSEWAPSAVNRQSSFTNLKRRCAALEHDKFERTQWLTCEGALGQVQKAAYQCFLTTVPLAHTKPILQVGTQSLFFK